MKKLVQNQTLTTILLIAAVALLILSGVQTSRAALTYISENYIAQVDTKRVGVVIVENGSDANGLLLKGLTPDDKMPLPGVRYPDSISIRNTGKIDSFDRVIVRKYWMNEDGTKRFDLSPSLIKLEIGDGWMIDEDATTEEMCVLYYPDKLAPGEVSAPFITAVTLDSSLQLMVTTTEEVTADGIYYTTVFNYNGVYVGLEAEANAVQTHNSGPAILSAWSVKIDVADDGESFSYGDPVIENYVWGSGDSPAPTPTPTPAPTPTPTTVTINYEATVGGTVSRASEALDPDSGTAQGCIAAASEGYYFEYWCNEDGEMISFDEEFIPEKVDGKNVAATYTAKFSEETTTINYTVRVNGAYDSSSGCSVSPSTNGFPGITGTPSGVTAIPADGYRFVCWTDANDNEVSTDLTFFPQKVDGAYSSTYIANFATTNSGGTAVVGG